MKMYLDMWSRLNNCFLKKCGHIPLYRNASIFLKKTIIRYRPKSTTFDLELNKMNKLFSSVSGGFSFIVWT